MEGESIIDGTSIIADMKCNDENCPVVIFNPSKIYGLLVNWCPYCGQEGEIIPGGS